MKRDIQTASKTQSPLKTRIRKARKLLATLICAAGATALGSIVGCTQTYYSVWETLGKDKRDLLRDNIEDVRDLQKNGKKEFEDALTQLRSLYGSGGGDLEKMYDKVKASYEASSARAESIQHRIDRVETVAHDLFAEWNNEIGQISDPALRKSSAQKRSETQARFNNLRDAMRRSEKSMQPVLVKLRDQSLYLKHNLNAQAVSHLGGEMKSIERSMEQLVKAMNKSIAEADAFVRSLPMS